MSRSGAAAGYRIDHNGSVTTLACLSTHYHADSMGSLTEKLKEADESTPSGLVVVDLTHVVLFSSTALRALRAAHLALEGRGGRIVAAGGGELVAGVLKFAPFLPHYPTVEAAVQALSGGADAKAINVRDKL
ncbi:MAG: hypothetical protein AAF360_14785 [Pseudomonadota bacterium]